MRTHSIRSWGTGAAALCFLILATQAISAHAAPAGAPTGTSGKEQQGPPVVIGVLGDSLGDGLWAGLYRLVKKDRHFEVIKKSKVSSGLTQITFYNWTAVAKTISKETDFQIAVIFLGANDQQALKHGKKWYRFRSRQWTMIYFSRITRLMKSLKKKGLEVYWVGLPVMQKDGFDKGARFLNGLYRQAAARQGVPYIDIRKVTAGEDGKYATHYKDRSGKMRLMRADDGVHFTMSGYIGIAHRVLARIRLERSKARRKRARLAVTADRAGPPVKASPSGSSGSSR